jgi:L-threonylcarbamoyladenylate synthase
MTRQLEEDIAAAAAALGRGEVVAYPTETFYGLGVNALDELALARLRHLKGREEGKPISVLVAGPEMVGQLCPTLPPIARRLMAAYWPGPLTLVLPGRRDLPRALLAEGCVAVRQSPHPVARELVAALGGPLTATSANRAGEAPATTAEAVEEIFEGHCRVIHGGDTAGGAPSTVARVRGGQVEILRPGALRIEVD